MDGCSHCACKCVRTCACVWLLVIVTALDRSACVHPVTKRDLAVAVSCVGRGCRLCWSWLSVVLVVALVINSSAGARDGVLRYREAFIELMYVYIV